MLIPLAESFNHHNVNVTFDCYMVKEKELVIIEDEKKEAEEEKKGDTESKEEVKEEVK
jgi:hypothetical protein